MISDLGESAKMALSYAVQSAQRMNHFYIGTEHLFLGVQELGDLNIEHQFSIAGISMGEVAKRIVVRTSVQPEMPIDEVNLTPRAERVTEAAIDCAQRLGQDSVEAPNIMIAILEQGKGVPARIIEDMGGDLEAISQNLERMVTRGEWDPGFYNQRKAIEQPGIETTSGLLENLGRDLTGLALEGKLDPLIGREKELLKMIQILLSRKKGNPIIVGDAGVGKTAIVEGLAQLIVSKKAPPELRGKSVETVEVGALVAGTIWRGAFEQKMLDFINKARENQDLIVFIDEIHMLVGAGAGSHSESTDAANILKPALSRGDFKCIGATTYSEYRKYIERDPALARRFQPVYVGESTPEDTLEILEGLRSKYEDFHEVKILDSALESAVELSHRYISDRRLPDKAIDLIDQACSERKLRTYYEFGEIDTLTREQRKGIFEDQVEIPKSTILLITREDVARTVSGWTGIPLGKLTEKESEKLLRLESLMKERLVGQDEAAHAVSQSIRASRSGLRDPKKPVGAFLFLGPTGVGKTELAKTLAEILFYDEDKIIRVDMSECYDRAFISRLIGSPSGYLDSEKGGQLTEAVKKRPYSIVLFDEVEKSDARVLDLLLQILDEGRLTDGLGRLVNFRNTVVIMTSNVGSAQISGKKRVGFDTRTEEERSEGLSREEVRLQVESELKRAFRPEFLNRIDEIVIFNPLTRENLRDIANLMLAKIPMMEVEASPRVIDFLIDARFDPAMGARPLRRTIEDFVVEPLANKIIEGKYSEQDTIKLVLSNGRVNFRKSGDAK